MDYHLENQIHKQTVRLVLEEVVLSPHKITLVYDGDDWTKDSSDDYQETSRIELKMEEIFEGDSERSESTFEHAILKLKTNYLARCQLKDLARAVVHGFKQPGAEDTDIGIRDAIITEMVHSLNRKHMIRNEEVEEFISKVKAELNK